MVLPWREVRALRLRGQEGYTIKWVEELAQLSAEYGFLVDYHENTDYVLYRGKFQPIPHINAQLKSEANRLGYSFETEHLFGDTIFYLGGRQTGIEITMSPRKNGNDRDVTIEFPVNIGRTKSVLVNRVAHLFGLNKAVGSKKNGYNEKTGEWRESVPDVYSNAFTHDADKLQL